MYIMDIMNRPKITRKPCYRKDDRAMRPIARDVKFHEILLA